MYEVLKGLAESSLVLYMSTAGNITRTSGLLKYLSTCADMSITKNPTTGIVTLNKNNLVQATAANQPRLVGGIAPGSRIAASNQNGESRYFTHAPVSFAANEAWSVTIITSLNGKTSSTSYNQYLFGSDIGGLRLNANSNTLAFSNDSVLNNTFSQTVEAFYGKHTLYTVTADGSGNLSLYLNGIINQTIAIGTNISLKYLLWGRSVAGNSQVFGKSSFYRLQSGAMTPAQVADEAALLATLYPEMESVVIGSQTWATRNFEAVASPVGNVIANVTEAAAVEKITNAADREFSSDTGFWSRSGNWQISGGSLNCNAGGGSTVRAMALSGKYYRVTYTITSYTSGSVRVYAGGNQSVGKSALGTYIEIIKQGSGNTNIGMWDSVSNFIGSVDNISIQELGFANSTEIYDAVYAATAGTAAEKHYAALKEAAMWCYYSNDVDNGAIYGKEYNGYAQMLFNLDFVTAGFGYHIPTEAEKATILAEVANDVNKLKMTGNDYWLDANGTNTTGLTLLGSGIRTADGSFVGLKEFGGFWTADGSELPTVGLPIRLIKD